ncbi:MAG: penicillin-binding protein [Deltaproteobacteria bacterium]|nr:penicillin-binding protein [Deltaproteobacteria bacterium]
MKRYRKKDLQRLERWKIMGLALVMVCGAAGLVSRAYYLQIVRHDFFYTKSLQQSRQAVEIRPERGEILDSRGNKLAISLESESVYVQPHKMISKKNTARKLARILPFSSRQIYRKLASKKSFVWIARDVLPGQAEKIKKLHLKGVGFVKESRRFYPNRELAGQLLGFVGVDSKGLEGIEHFYDRYLQGKKNIVFLERDARRGILDPGDLGSVEGTRGKTVMVTIDRTIQHTVEQELARTVAGSGAKRGLAMVMDVESGAILAMSQYPFFNPNSFTSSKPSIWRNRAVVDMLEPGSTFKVFTVAAALDQGVITPDDCFDCEQGKYRVGGRIIHDTHKHGKLNVTEIVKLSSNIGCSKIAARLGKQDLYEFLSRCGFGSRTGIDFPGEKQGILRDWHRWRDVDLSNISFGQGVGVTPVQLMMAYAALANGGYLVKPYLVQAVVNENGWKVYEHHVASGRRRAFSPKVARQVLAMLEKVVDDDGTAPKARIPGYRVAGKTGTSQKYDPQKKKYSRKNYLASFIGFIPAPENHGKLLIYVMVDEPRTSIYGGMVAAPAFSRIGQRLLAYLNVEPSSRVMLAVREPEESEKTAKREAGISASVTSIVTKKSALTADTGIMPDFSGRSVRDVLAYFGTLPGSLAIHGSGKIMKQKPRPGQRIVAGVGMEFVLQTEN